MQGSTVESMADAIDGYFAVVYGVYLESANCRMEVRAIALLAVCLLV